MKKAALPGNEPAGLLWLSENPSGFSDKRIAVCCTRNFGAEHQNSTLAAIAQGVPAGLVVRYLCTGGKHSAASPAEYPL